MPAPPRPQEGRSQAPAPLIYFKAGARGEIYACARAC